jgi:1,4-alpha-glucan branching enzyme
MPVRHTISVALEAHEPFFCKTNHACVSCSTNIENPNCTVSSAMEEARFFESLSETYLPLLEMLDRLDQDRVPFRLGVSVSPILCHHLEDSGLLERYVEYLDRQIEFGKAETQRYWNNRPLRELAQYYRGKFRQRRGSFTVRYGGNILKALDAFQHKGKIEILAASATHAFLPFYVPYPEAVQAQIEVALSTHHRRFGKFPQGFFLSDLGWTGELEKFLRAYNLGYTVVEAHGLAQGSPPAEKGSFYPLRTPQGVFVLGRDYYAGTDLREISRGPLYRDNGSDSGFDLPADMVGAFLGQGGARLPTGYKYRTRGAGTGALLTGTYVFDAVDEDRAAFFRREDVYDPAAAAAQAAKDAGLFLHRRLSRLNAAAALMNQAPLCLCVFKAGDLGRSWYEGFDFLEQVFRQAAARDDVQFMTPAEYLYKQNSRDFQISRPGYSSRGANGYGETWLDVSNDWMYRHVFRALERMIELAERFPDDSGLKERALNQAAREILLAQSSDWPGMLYRQESSGLARSEIEDALRNFTTIYEALGSNYISTEWLTNLERRHSIFPHINYRIFRRKK